MNKLHIKLNIQRFAATGSISCAVLSQSSLSNTSNVRITFTVKRTSGSTYWSSAKTVTVHCDGQTATTTLSLPSNKTSNSCSVDFNNISHNADGTKSINYDASIATGTSAGTITASGGTTLPTIPRYTSITSCYQSGGSETSVELRWQTSENCSQIRYGLSTSNYTTINVSGNSGNIEITGLTAGTTNTIYIMPCRSESGLWGNGSANAWYEAHASTNNYPIASQVPDITLNTNSDIFITFDNELNREFSCQLISNVDNSVIFTVQSMTGTNLIIPMSYVLDAFYETIPNALEGTYYVKTTCLGNTRNSTNKKYTVDPDISKPIMSTIGYEDINATTLALTDDDQSLIAGYSTIQVTIPANNKATARKYATITGYKIENGLYSSEVVPEEEGEDIILTCPATSSIINVYAIDSRGQSGIYQIANATLINYTSLTKNQNPTAQRCDSNGTPNGVGEYVKITMGGTFWNDTFGDVTNSITAISYEYANTKTPSQTTTGTTTITATTSNNTYSIAQLILGDTVQGFDVSNSYIVNVTVEDELSSTTFTVTFGSGTPHICYDEDGVCIMGKYDKTKGGLLQVAGEPISGGGGEVSGDTLPIGAIIPYSSTTIPTNWLECNGQAVSRTDYADLFRVIGTTFGSGDGSTTFNVPNIKKRVPVGYDSSDSDFDTIGETGGSKAHKHRLPLFHSYANGSGGPRYVNWNGANYGISQTAVTIQNGAYGDLNPAGYPGTATAYPMMSDNESSLQPYITTTYIIKAQQSAGVVANVTNATSVSTTDTYSCNYTNTKLKETNGTVLFEDSNGKVTDITMSDSSANYTKLDFYFCKSANDRRVQSIYYANGTSNTLYTMNAFATSGTFMQELFKHININGTSVTSDYGWWRNSTSNTVSCGLENDVKIYKIVGYK